MAVACIFAVFYTSPSSASFLQKHDHECRSIRAEGAAVLFSCGDKLKSLSIGAGGLWEEAGRDLHGVFYFKCRNLSGLGPEGVYDKLLSGNAFSLNMESECLGWPVMNGLFISTSEWMQSKKDEQSILVTYLKNMPLHFAAKEGGFQLACPAFDVQMGDRLNRAACFQHATSGQAFIVMIGGDEEAGFVISYTAREMSVESMKTMFSVAMRYFNSQSGSGDLSLSRWLK
jgi:hypothetical protein